MLRHYLLGLILALPAALKGQDSLSSVCERAVTTVDMRRCASHHLESAQGELQRYLQEARRVAGNRALLDSAQGAWEHYRDLACRAAGSEYQGGTVQPVVILSCLVHVNRARIRQLYDAYLKTSDTTLPEPKP